MNPAIDHWRSMIQAEHAQSDNMRQTDPPLDHWRSYAQQFSTDPRRSDDALLNRLLRELSPDHTLIDVGAGGGRLALPIALHCKHVTAVEPSESMGKVLTGGARDHHIENISLVRSRWEEAEVDNADQILAVHVIYTVQDIDRFVRKLQSHARVQAMVVIYGTAPQSQMYPLWEMVHGRPRLALPSAPEFKEVLRELHIDSQEEALPAQPPRGFDSPDQALEQISLRLYLGQDDPKRDVLGRILEHELNQSDGAFQIKGAVPLQPWLIRLTGSVS